MEQPIRRSDQGVICLKNENIMTTKEAAVYIGVSLSTFYKMSAGRKIPKYAPSGKKLYFLREDLDAWMLSNRQATIVELENNAVDFLTFNKRRV